MDQVKVSIIVPIYNVKKYITKALETISNQTLKEIEIILINDGSTDSSGEIADQYALLDKRIRVLHQENMGVSYARNRGVEVSQVSI